MRSRRFSCAPLILWLPLGDVIVKGKDVGAPMEKGTGRPFCMGDGLRGVLKKEALDRDAGKQ